MPRWEQRFDEYRLEEAAQLIEVEPHRIKQIGGFENIVYSFPKNGQDLILRVGYSTHRTPEMVAAEMHFMDYLAAHQVRIAKPVRFSNGELIACIASGEEQFILSVFEKAPGGHINASHPDWGPGLFQRWGEITGMMHDLEQEYQLPEGMQARPHQDIIGFDTSLFGAEEHELYTRLIEVDAQINALPHERTAYGLCHRDLHPGNFFVQERNIIAFDFDDCGYDYFVQDIAIAVYYGTIFGDWNVPIYDVEQASAVGNLLYKEFMTGYNRHYRLEDHWIRQLPLFIEKRRLELCLLLYKPYHEAGVSEAKRSWLRHNIEAVKQGIPCMKLEL